MTAVDAEPYEFEFDLKTTALVMIDFRRAAVYAPTGAVLSYCGFIHGAKLGIGESSGVALGYVPFALIGWGLARRASTPQIS